MLAIKALNERFDSETELATLQVSIFPQPEVRGTGLVVRYKGRRDVPPLITIKSFSACAVDPRPDVQAAPPQDHRAAGPGNRVPPGGLRGTGASLPPTAGRAGAGEGLRTSRESAAGRQAALLSKPPSRRS